MAVVVLIAPGTDPVYTTIQVGPFTIVYEPTFFAFASYVRLMAMLVGTIFYFSTNRERDVLVGLRSLRLPLVASYVIALSIRAAAMFLEDYRTISEAEQARGLELSGARMRDRIKAYTTKLVPLFAIALRRTDEISTALFTRGYTLKVRNRHARLRTDYILSKYRMTAHDWISIMLLCAVFSTVAAAALLFRTFEIADSPLNDYLRRALNIQDSGFRELG